MYDDYESYAILAKDEEMTHPFEQERQIQRQQHHLEKIIPRED